MRILGIGDDCNLGDMYYRLGLAGHEVKVFGANAQSCDVMRGLVHRVPAWENELPWIRDAGEEGIVLFESVDRGDIQDSLRREGFNVIGGSAFGDRLETDREFGQEAMRAAGMRTAPSRTFESFSDGLDYVRSRPRRYVIKLNGSIFASWRNCVGQLEDGADIAALLRRHLELWQIEQTPSFILMDYMDGVEVGVGGYFNGQEFMDPVVIDFEHKRFFDNDLGELTGEMGTLVSYRHARPLFEATLERMTDQLRDGRYVGYININTVVNDQGIWPLEFTARFGYPGFAICDALHAEGWDNIFRYMISRKRLDFKTHDGFAIGVVLTVPPFPQSARYAEISKGLPILFRDNFSIEDQTHLHFCEVEMRNGEFLTSGEIGYLMVATGRGATAQEAREKAYALTGRVVVPNLRYRSDIGCKFIEREEVLLKNWGLWG